MLLFCTGSCGTAALLAWWAPSRSSMGGREARGSSTQLGRHMHMAEWLIPVPPIPPAGGEAGAALQARSAAGGAAQQPARAPAQAEPREGGWATGRHFLLQRFHEAPPVPCANVQATDCRQHHRLTLTNLPALLHAPLAAGQAAVQRQWPAVLCAPCGLRVLPRLELPRRRGLPLRAFPVKPRRGSGAERRPATCKQALLQATRISTQTVRPSNPCAFLCCPTCRRG